MKSKLIKNNSNYFCSVQNQNQPGLIQFWFGLTQVGCLNVKIKIKTWTVNESSFVFGKN